VIKLKDILTESTKVELHKVITDKTEPAFMTEEQWSKKWYRKTSLNETTQLIEEHTTINEKVYSRIFEGLGGDMPKISDLRKSIIKFTSSLRPNSKSSVILRKYLLTGKISLPEATKVVDEYIKFIYKVMGGTIGAALLALSTKIGNAWVAWPFFMSIFGFAAVSVIGTIIPRGNESIIFQYMADEPNRATYFKKNYPDSYKQLDSKQKKEVDKLIDKHIEQKKNSAFSKAKEGLFTISKKIFPKLR
jgi:hypothetical protein